MDDVPSATATFNLVDSNGTTTKIHVKPSYAQKPKAVENLLKSLPPLLTEAAMPTSTIKSFGTRGWDLDETGDTIHRYALLRDHQKVLEQIKEAATELKHDPHIHINGSEVTLSCTTHVPPGLSMKDVKLAKRIDEILASVSTYQDSNHHDEAEILTRRQRGREHNMEAARKARLSCKCG